MSDIHIVRRHHLTLAEAKQVVQEAADDLAAEYELESEWQGNTLHFSRSGVDGTMTVKASEIELEVKLGFLLRAFRGNFESHIERHLGQRLDEHKAMAKVARKTTKKA